MGISSIFWGIFRNSIFLQGKIKVFQFPILFQNFVRLSILIPDIGKSMGKVEKVLVGVNLFFLLGILIAGVNKSSKISDFRDYYRASGLMTEQKDIYHFEEIKELSQNYTLEDLFKTPGLIDKLESLKGEVASYIYPPTFAFLLIPLTYLSYEKASLIFFLVNFVCLLGAIYFLRNLLPPGNYTHILFVSLLFNFRFLENHANNNQVAFILLFLILFSIHTKNPFLSGWMLSLATIIKLTPLIFILYFIYERKYKVIFYFGLGLLFWAILPLLGNLDYGLINWKNWYEMVLLSAMKNPIFRAWKNNQSLIGTLAKYFLEGADPLNQTLFRMPFYSLSIQAVKLIFNFFVLLILFPLFYRYRKGIEPAQHISALFILSVILSGISWIHTFSFLIFPIAYLYYMVSKEKGYHIKKILFYTFGILIIISGKNIGGSVIDSISLMYSLLLYLGIGFYLLVITYSRRHA